MPTCCGAEKHGWDRQEVERRWLPTTLRCFVVGENPGDTTSEYFYERPASYAADEVTVRRALLRGLHEQGLIAEATLEGFQEAGFLFDHAIRCQLPPTGRHVRAREGDSICVARRGRCRSSSAVARSGTRGVGNGAPREQRRRERVCRLSETETEDLDATLPRRDRSRLTIFRVGVPQLAHGGHQGIGGR